MGSKTFPGICLEGLSAALSKIESRRGRYTFRFSRPG